MVSCVAHGRVLDFFTGSMKVETSLGCSVLWKLVVEWKLEWCVCESVYKAAQKLDVK